MRGRDSPPAAAATVKDPRTGVRTAADGQFFSSLLEGWLDARAGSVLDPTTLHEILTAVVDETTAAAEEIGYELLGAPAPAPGPAAQTQSQTISQTESQTISAAPPRTE